MNFEFDLTITMSLLFSAATFLYVWFRTRRTDVDERFKAGAKRMDAHDLRIQALEKDLSTLPGKDHLHRLEVALTEIGGDMKAMRATMRGMSESMARTETIVGRHEDHLLEGGKK